MNNKLSVLLSRKLIISGIIQKEFEAIYIYGFELLLSFVVSVSIILALSILIRKFFESLIFLVLFIAIRQFTGGFHARTYLKCQIFTILFYVSVIVFASIFPPCYALYFVQIIFSTISIAYIGPIESPNKPLTDKQRHRNKLKGLILFETVSIFAVFIRNICQNVSAVIFYTLSLIIILMIIPYIEKRMHND